eukprot:1259681-Rhodomonas_salina.1
MREARYSTSISTEARERERERERDATATKQLGSGYWVGCGRCTKVGACAQVDCIQMHLGGEDRACGESESALHAGEQCCG